MPAKPSNNKPSAPSSGFEWRLAEVMRRRGIDSVMELHRRLEQAGFTVSKSTLFRLYHEPPQLLCVPTMLSIMRILDCKFEDLLHPVPGPAGLPPAKAISAQRLARMLETVPFRTIHEIRKAEANTP